MSAKQKSIGMCWLPFLSFLYMQNPGETEEGAFEYFINGQCVLSIIGLVQLIHFIWFKIKLGIKLKSTTINGIL